LKNQINQKKNLKKKLLKRRKIMMMIKVTSTRLQCGASLVLKRKESGNTVAKKIIILLKFKSSQIFKIKYMRLLNYGRFV